MNRCSQPGCSEAKLIYLHMKICAAGPGASCPTGHKGCNDSRKLLAHYRKCREIRARQAGQHPRIQQHACLVCTLVARQARSMLDMTPSSQRKPNRKHSINSVSNNLEARLSFHRNSKEASMVPSPPPNSPNGNRKVTPVSVSPEDLEQSFQMPQIMPPPTTRITGVSSLGMQQRVQFEDENTETAGLSRGAGGTLTTTRPRSDSVPAPRLYSRHASPLVQEERDQSPQRSNQQSQPNGRRRSLSCGGISALGGGSPLGCETIHEEEPGVSGGDRDFEDILNDCWSDHVG